MCVSDFALDRKIHSDVNRYEGLFRLPWSLIYTPPAPISLLYGSRYPRMVAHRTYSAPTYEIVGVGMRTRQRPMAAQARAEVDTRRRIQVRVPHDLPVGRAWGRHERPQRRAPTRRVRLRGAYLPLQLLLGGGGVRTARVHDDVVEAGGRRTRHFDRAYVQIRVAPSMGHTQFRIAANHPHRGGHDDVVVRREQGGLQVDHETGGQSFEFHLLVFETIAFDG